MTDTYKTICKLVSTVMFGSAISYDEDIDWSDVFYEMKAQGIAPIVGDILKELPMNSETKEEWQDYLIFQRLHWEKVMSIQDNICSKILLEIPYAIIKGISSAINYPNPTLRSMGDVDVLVDCSSFDMVTKCLVKHEFKVIDEVDYRNTTFQKNGVEVEIHRRYATKLQTKEPLVAEKYIIGGLVNTKDRIISNHSFKCLPPLAMGLTLLVHIYLHLFDGIGFRQIIDWMMFVHSYNDTDWNEFNKIAKEDGLYRLQCTVTKMCCIYFGLPETTNIKWIYDVDNLPCDELFEYCEIKGNFGQKLHQEDFRDKFAFDNKILGFFSRLQLGGIRRWKAAKKYKILRPFAWLYQGSRILSIMIHRNNPIEALGKDICESKKIKKLYEKLGIKRVDCSK